MRRAPALGTDDAASSSPTRCRWTSSSTRRCTTGCSPTGSPPPTQAGVRGKDVTPFLLEHFHRASEGASLEVNIRIVLRNAELAARIAAAAPRAALTTGRGPRRSRRRRRRRHGRRRRASMSGPLAPGSRHARRAMPHRRRRRGRQRRRLAGRGRACRRRSSAGSGDDPLGRESAAELADGGRRRACAVDPSAPTGTCVVLGRAGRRALDAARRAART